MQNIIPVLRRAGFYSFWNDKTNEEIFELIYQDRKAKFSEIFGYEYDPGRDIDDLKLALADRTKMIYWDLEASVGEGNNVYVRILEDLDSITGQPGVISNAVESWDASGGKVTLSLNLAGEPKVYHPAVIDDWLDDKLLIRLLVDLEKASGISIFVSFGPQDLWSGQAYAFVRLSKFEREIVSNELGWTFLKLADVSCLPGDIQ